MKRFLTVFACLVCAVAFAAPASAATLDFHNLIGTVVPGTPANPSDERVYGNNLIDWYNGDIVNPSNPDPSLAYQYNLSVGSAVPLPDLTRIVGDGVRFLTPEEGGWAPIDTTGYTYLFAKFGTDGALYWLGGLTSFDGFDPAWGPYTRQGGGLSHVTLFNPTQVPEAGALLMFGTGLIGLVGYRRVRRMQ